MNIILTIVFVILIVFSVQIQAFTQISINAIKDVTGNIVQDYELYVGDSTTIAGKIVTLMNVGSQGSIIIKVDDVIDTILSDTTKDVNDLSITIIQTQHSDVKTERYAVLSISTEVCVDTTWSPDLSTVCGGETFTQTSNCGNTQHSTGTKVCLDGYICQTNLNEEGIKTGECIKEEIECIDSDNGRNYYTKGYVTEEGIKSYDECIDQNILLEYYCTGDLVNPAVGIKYRCSNGCSNGACIKTTCVEDWQCSVWSDCIGSKRTRICNDLNNCGTIQNKPKEIEQCMITQEAICGNGICDSSEYTLNRKESVTFLGKQVTLLNVGPQSIIVKVGDIIESFIDEKIINEIRIKVIETSYSERKATISLSESNYACLIDCQQEGEGWKNVLVLSNKLSQNNLPFLIYKNELSDVNLKFIELYQPGRIVHIGKYPKNLQFTNFVDITSNKFTGLKKKDLIILELDQSLQAQSIINNKFGEKDCAYWINEDNFDSLTKYDLVLKTAVESVRKNCDLFIGAEYSSIIKTYKKDYKIKSEKQLTYNEDDTLIIYPLEDFGLKKDIPYSLSAAIYAMYKGGNLVSINTNTITESLTQRYEKTKDSINSFITNNKIDTKNINYIVIFSDSNYHFIPYVDAEGDAGRAIDWKYTDFNDDSYLDASIGRMATETPIQLLSLVMRSSFYSEISKRLDTVVGLGYGVNLMGHYYCPSFMDLEPKAIAEFADKNGFNGISIGNNVCGLGSNKEAVLNKLSKKLFLLSVALHGDKDAWLNTVGNPNLDCRGFIIDKEDFNSLYPTLIFTTSCANCYYSKNPMCFDLIGKGAIAYIGWVQPTFAQEGGTRLTKFIELLKGERLGDINRKMFNLDYAQKPDMLVGDPKLKLDIPRLEGYDIQTPKILGYQKLSKKEGFVVIEEPDIQPSAIITTSIDSSEIDAIKAECTNPDVPLSAQFLPWGYGREIGSKRRFWSELTPDWFIPEYSITMDENSYIMNIPDERFYDDKNGKLVIGFDHKFYDKQNIKKYKFKIYAPNGFPKMIGIYPEDICPIMTTSGESCFSLTNHICVPDQQDKLCISDSVPLGTCTSQGVCKSYYPCSIDQDCPQDVDTTKCSQEGKCIAPNCGDGICQEDIILCPEDCLKTLETDKCLTSLDCYKAFGRGYTCVGIEYGMKGICKDFTGQISLSGYTIKEINNKEKLNIINKFKEFLSKLF